MEAQAKYRNIKGSERKMRLVVDTIRGKKRWPGSRNFEAYPTLFSTFSIQDLIVSSCQLGANDRNRIGC